jgi:hypothetical protein
MGCWLFYFTTVLKSKKGINNDFKVDKFAINLIGHGSIVAGNSVDDLKGIEFVRRPSPELLDN